MVYGDLKYVLDRLFTFMLFVTIAVFIMEWQFGVDESALHAVEYVSMGVLGGYYVFFAHGVYKAKHKLDYFKKHWILVILLILPFIPVARFARYVKFERLFVIGADSLWHLFDELGLL